MPSIASLLNSIISDFPALNFAPGDNFYWSPDNNTVYYAQDSKDTASLLHELAHGILDHTGYSRDIQLIEMERDAWDYAVTLLGPRYGAIIEDSTVQGGLDSYRDWLHARSSCPACNATGFQTKKYQYNCPVCSHRWKVNDARLCGLKRYSIKN
ncbi:MAG: hypothetical protein ABIQ04_03330 [Candidatus Saccharimonadales bacterium]